MNTNIYIYIYIQTTLRRKSKKLTLDILTGLFLFFIKNLVDLITDCSSDILLRKSYG